MSAIAAAQPQQPQPHAPLSPAGSPQPPAPGSPGSLQQQESAVGPVRRKTSRRANTAERRATHNAVERQRRETLNSRFLDLAALLPNLASVRRPSKSAIVNSSIVLIHAQRRARAVAGRELRSLKAETDALRRELNEWRDRAALPRVDEQPRTAEFGALLALEEFSDEMGEDERRAYEGRNGDADELDDDELDAGGAPPFHAVPSQMHHAPLHQHHQHQHHHARVAIHTAFEQHGPIYDTPLSAISMHSAPEPVYAPSAGGYPQMFTPPGSSHGAPPLPTAQAPAQPFLGQRYAPAHQHHQLFPQHAVSGSPLSDDDAASIGSAHSGGSPPHMPATPFELVPQHLVAGLGPREMANAAAAGFGWPVQFKPVPVPVGGPFMGAGVIM